MQYIPIVSHKLTIGSAMGKEAGYYNQKSPKIAGGHASYNINNPCPICAYDGKIDMPPLIRMTRHRFRKI